MILGCATRGHPIGASPGGRVEVWDGNREHWAAVAARNAEAMDGSSPPTQWLRLAQLWDRAGDPIRADAAMAHALRDLGNDTQAVSLRVVRQVLIDEAFVIGDCVVLVRRVEYLDGDVQRIELWSPSTPSRPQWVEYVEGTDGWREAVGRFGRSGACRAGLVEPTSTAADTGSLQVDFINGGRALIVHRDGRSPQTMPVAVGDLQRDFLFESDPVITGVTVSRDQRLMAGITHGGTIRLFDLETGASQTLGFPYESAALPHGVDQVPSYDRAALIAFDGNEELFAVFVNGDLARWSTRDGSRVAYLAGGCSRSELRAWRTANATASRREEANCAHVSIAELSYDGRYVATVGKDSVRIRQTSDGASVAYRAEWSTYYSRDSLAFGENGLLLYASSDSERPVLVWSPERGWQRLIADPVNPSLWHPALSGSPRMFGRQRVDVPAPLISMALGQRAKWARWNMDSRNGRYAWLRRRRHNGGRTKVLRAAGVRIRQAEPEDPWLHVERISDGVTVARMRGLPDGGWVALSKSGAIDGTRNALDYLVAVVETPNARSVMLPHLLWNQRHVPGLMQAALAGRDTLPPD